MFLHVADATETSYDVETDYDVEGAAQRCETVCNRCRIS